MTTENQDKHYEFITDFADEIINEIINDDEKYISVLGKYDNVKNLICALMEYDDVTFENLEIYSGDYNNYVDEFVLGIWQLDGNVVIGCEPAKRDGKYFYYDGDRTYIFDDCCSRVIKNCISDMVYFVSIEGSDFEDAFSEAKGCDLCNGNICVDNIESENNEIHGFTASITEGDTYRSFSYHTDEPLSMDTIYSVIKNLIN